MTEEQVYREIGRRVRALRHWQGLKQEDVADSLGMTRGSIANMETGRQRVSIWVLLQLSDLLRVPAYVWLLNQAGFEHWANQAGVSLEEKELGRDGKWDIREVTWQNQESPSPKP